MTAPMRKKLVAALTAALALCLSPSASAQNPFIIDGVVPANGTPTGPAQTNDPFGSAKELGPVNSSGTKVGVIHTAVQPMLDFTNPNGQVDLRTIWTQTQKASNNDVWFYFAWQRDSNTGSGFIAYEFQQAALSPSCVYSGAGIDMVLPQSAAETTLINTCNPWKNRQAGDFLIMWDQAGSALTITKRVFSLSGGQLVLGPNQVLGSAVAAISADGFRGEAAIDLTTDVFPPNACVSFANIIPGTVTGNSDSADYKDTVLSVFEPVSNCGVVTVRKVTQPAGGTGTFPYTLQRADGSPIRFDGTLAINQTLTHDGDSTGSPILNLLVGGNYTLTEGTVSSPWELLSIVCTVNGGTPVNLTGGGVFSVEAGKTTACTITNKRRRGSIRVIKHVINDNGGTAVASDFTISLGDSANTVFAGVANPGVTYTFDEGYAFNVAEVGLPAGYQQISASGDCSGAIVADVTKVCAITNDDIPPRLIVIKHVINDNGGTATAGSFTMQVAATNPSASSFPGAEAPGTTITLNVGAFNVTEISPAGYTQVSAVGCSGTIALGETKTCTITNDDNRAAPSGTTVQRVVLHDAITISGIRPGAPGAAATVTFRLYSDAGCSALVGAEGPVAITLNGTTGTSTTVAGVGPVSASGNYFWRVQYTGDQFNAPFTTACGAEQTSVTFVQ